MQQCVNHNQIKNSVFFIFHYFVASILFQNKRRAKLITVHARFGDYSHVSKSCGPLTKYDSDKIAAEAFSTLEKYFQSHDGYVLHYFQTHHLRLLEKQKNAFPDSSH